MVENRDNYPCADYVCRRVLLCLVRVQSDVLYFVRLIGSVCGHDRVDGRGARVCDDTCRESPVLPSGWRFRGNSSLLKENVVEECRALSRPRRRLTVCSPGCRFPSQPVETSLRVQPHRTRSRATSVCACSVSATLLMEAAVSTMMSGKFVRRRCGFVRRGRHSVEVRAIAILAFYW